MSLQGRCRLAAAAMLALAALLVVACPGCGDDGEGAYGEEAENRDEVFCEERDGGAGGGETGVRGSEVVHMCGRSVLGGWFDYWGWDYDPENPVRFGSRCLVYHEMEVPPEIVDSARDAAREAAEGGGDMFFKLCFDDFTGGDEPGARENLRSNREIVREVVENAVEDKGLTLILGNALPKVREYTDEWLVWNQREYNRFLDELAREYGERVVVLDLYGVLAASGGWLRPEYTDDPYDSHLNADAYRALDGELSKALGE